MEHLNYMFVLLLCAGVSVLCFRPQWNLRARAEYYYGMGRAKVQSSGIKDVWAKLKASGKRDTLLRELSESLAYVKNIVVLGRGKNVSSELLLTELSDVTRQLSPVYIEMAGCMHMNDKERAAAVMENVVPGSIASDVARLLTGWEDLDPDDLLSTVELYQTSLRESRSTDQLKKDELISDLIYFQVVINCMVVLLNFIYVGYFIEQQEALKFLF